MTAQTQARLNRRAKLEARKIIFNGLKLSLAFALWFGTFAAILNQ